MGLPGIVCQPLNQKSHTFCPKAIWERGQGKEVMLFQAMVASVTSNTR